MIALLVVALAAGPAGAIGPAEAGLHIVLENEYVRVTRNGASCAEPGPGCGDRVVVALGDVRLPLASGEQALARGDIHVVPARERYIPPREGAFLEVVIKPDHPPVKSPEVLIPPEKNSVLFDGPAFFVFEEKLDPGDTRGRHSHSQRVVIVLNATRLQQWPDGQAPVFRDQIPDDVRFNPPVIHVVKTIGERPLRNIVIELKPAAR